MSKLITMRRIKSSEQAGDQEEELTHLLENEAEDQDQEQEQEQPRRQPNVAFSFRRRPFYTCSFAFFSCSLALLSVGFLIIIVLVIFLVVFSTPSSLRETLSHAQVPENTTLKYTEYPLQDPYNTTKSTIVLIHGACSSAREWDLVVPHLHSTYHLLIPDLPYHGRDYDITPFTLDISGNLIAQLIRTRAHSGRAHVVGLSLGAHVAAHLVSTHPLVVQSVVASGWRHWGRPWYTPLIPPFLVFSAIVQDAAPRWLVKWITDGADVRRNENGGCDLTLVREWVEAAASEVVTPAGPEIDGGVLVVAGTRSPGDSAVDANLLAGLLRGNGTYIKCVQGRHLSHPWNRQAPKLFADLIMARIDGKQLPEDFEEC